MHGPGPGDGDLIEMGRDKLPRRRGAGGRGRRVIVVTGACALLVAGAALAAVRLSSSAPANPALSRLIAAVTTVPVGETVTAPAATGAGGAAAPGSGDQAPPPSGPFSSTGTIVLIDPSAPHAVSGPPLTADGKPEVLYVATEYCPYCVAENWALIVALSRFGTFSGLRTSRSPAYEGIAPVDGWTFYGSSYASRYLTFVPVETASNVLAGQKADSASAAGYRRLERLTPAEQATFTRLDDQQLTPFLDLGGRAAQLGSDVMPSALARLTWNEIAADLRRPSSPAGRTILASVDGLTAELCRLTDSRPAPACAK